MNNKTIKKWSIFIYADGNNEMEPEMYKSMLDSEKIGSNDEINVLMQIGRADRSLAEIMRPSKIFPDSQDNWTGVRRYYIKNTKSSLIDNLGKINMADPNNLYEFIKDGIKNYKAEHYMLVLSGHGIKFIGGLTDLTFDIPYMMGIPEMAKSINLVKKELSSEIDVLLLDMCYMNSIEVIYELGKQNSNAVKNMVTYINKAPFKGLPYDKLISITQKYSKINDINLFLEYFINEIKYNLIAFEINYTKLKQIKGLYSNLAYSYLCCKDKSILKPSDLLRITDPKNQFFKYSKNVTNILLSLIIHSANQPNEKNLPIEIASQKMDELISYYSRLAFAANNYWSCLLSDTITEKYLISSKKIDLKPTALLQSTLYSFISQLNPSISEHNLSLSVQKMSEYKRNKKPE